MAQFIGVYPDWRSLLLLVLLSEESSRRFFIFTFLNQNVVVVVKHAGYGHNNSANLEHDDTVCVSNYSDCADIMLSAEAEHADWTEGYDY